MKSVTIASLLTAAATLAAAQNSTVALGIVNATAYDIIDSTNALDRDINAFTPTRASECGLQSAAEDLLSVLANGTDTIRPLPSFPPDGMDLNLVGAFQGLQDTVIKTIDDLVSKQSAINNANVGSVVLHYISEILVSAQDYAGDLVPKIETDAQGIASGYSSTIISAIRSGSSAFADQAGGPTSLTTCGPTSSGSSSSGSATTSSSSTITPSSGTGSPATVCPTTTITTTEVVSTLTTFCPGPTTVTYGSGTYTVTEATTLTVTDCK